MTLQETLSAAGMEPVQAEIYLVLLQNGESTVPAILKHTDLSRASVYDALSVLLADSYVEYRKEGRNAYYTPVHPNKLFSLIEQKKRDVALLEGELTQTIDSLTGTYNLGMHKPGVRFFEGLDGIKEVLWDSLDAKDEILTMGDLETFIKHSKPVNDEYMKIRRERNIKKRALSGDSPFNRDFLAKYDSGLTYTRLLSSDHPLFHSTIVEIYNNKISYATFTQTSMIGVIIEDTNIANYHRSIFELLWQQAKTFTPPQQ
ncbi:MAG: hypothetical protein COU35_00270 [Candidatus Magasanikbacteria bacterium CG10_big_fil_rev_8_21_14_0_10_47_10]|uniref:HTH arsR-type domain-containing protein n=1 Tax=Candidatus Magasanikbacteria bacterium CG10_big_fil_rev_8_21_14_0_10_47_10 TaxID=1974652 RepID=A0A2H0TRN2_9BACT|nr:MAG: hypothetical protein COU35_00270 [Candidatus Magasanikbacteria bacterium CG10_big_fil_rev_8_21_14_0_10_47_10]